MALDRTNVSEERIAFIVREERLSELETTLAATSNRRALRRNTVLTRATRRHVLEYDIIHSHRSENLKSYIALTS
jgi:hypothetical protein